MPEPCTCGVVHANGCPGALSICIARGFLFEWTYTQRNRLTGAPMDWPAGTQARIRFSWGTGTEMIVPVAVDGPHLIVTMTGVQTEQIPRAALATIDLNFDDGAADRWRPWRQGKVAACH